MKKIFTPILFILFFLAGTAFLFHGGNTKEEETVQNVFTAKEGQIIEVKAKGGYSPKISTAKAEIATTLKMKTNGTFDCSSALRIPGINYSGNLPMTGETLIPIPPQPKGTIIQAMCGMGMYNFLLKFE